MSDEKKGVKKPGKPKVQPSKGFLEVRMDVPLEDLKADPKNPRTWDAENLRLTKASIERFGFVEPVIVNERTHFLVSGHQRIAILRKDGAKTCPLVVFGDWTATDGRALAFVLNAKAPRGRFVTKKARPLIEDLQRSMPKEFAQLGLGTILEQAENEESGADSGKKNVQYDEKVRTIRHRVAKSLYDVYLRCMARAKEMCVEDGLKPDDVEPNVALEKILAEFATTNGEPKSVEDQPKKKAKE